MLAALYAHGAPPRMEALAAHLAQRAQEDFWRKYMAQALWLDMQRAHKKPPMESYISMLDKGKHHEKKTAEELREELLARLREE